MQNELFDKLLKFIELMTQQNGTTRQEICNSLNISVRSFYRYIEYFKNAGFNVIQVKKNYSFNSNSPFFRKIMAFNFFSKEEIDAILEIMEQTPCKDEKTEVLYRRLLHQKKWHTKNQYIIDKEYTEKVEILNTAISEKKLVVFHNYSSVRSKSITDRIVEPYNFMGHNDSVRCFELSTGGNKTFRLSRIGSIELLPVNWYNEEKHNEFFVDAFNFSGESQYPVEVKLNFRAVRLLVEEYPSCAHFLTRKSNEEWVLKMNVCDFRGIGRFCIGLFRDVKPIGSQAFLDYLNNEMKELKESKYFIPEKQS